MGLSRDMILRPIRLAGMFLLYLMAAAVVAVIIQGPELVADEEGSGDFETSVQLLAFEIVVTVGTILLVWWRLRARGENARDIGLDWKREFVPSLALGPVLGTTVKVVSIPIAVIAYFLGARSEVPQMEMVGTLGVLAAICGGALAGVHEEIFFRGYFRIRLAKILRDPVPGGGLWRTGLVTSLLFGSLHGYQGWLGIITTAFVGLMFFAIATYKRFGLLHAILAHAAFNAIAFAMLAALDGSPVE